jgi:hypothetical protein
MNEYFARSYGMIMISFRDDIYYKVKTDVSNATQL